MTFGIAGVGAARDDVALFEFLAELLAGVGRRRAPGANGSGALRADRS